jgi:hypothetical protein
MVLLSMNPNTFLSSYLEWLTINQLRQEDYAPKVGIFKPESWVLLNTALKVIASRPEVL